jgi:hypothetical protein
MAQVMTEAGCQPYLQFGEVQWWYFPLAGSGMPFYDDYTKTAFQAQYQREMRVIPSRESDPALYAEEAAFLPGLIGEFTQSVMDYVRASLPNCRFEVLYPVDVNDSALNRLVNYPAATWTPAKLNNLKTESFSYTYARNLNLSRTTVEYGTGRGFTPTGRSFLVGISDAQTPWEKEAAHAAGEGVESIVLFALDQFCLVGYALPGGNGRRVFSVK